ncbi:MAG: putative porin [Desulfobacterales bacterium]|nr:putative porin [Desulfobacterales bacterium]
MKRSRIFVTLFLTLVLCRPQVCPAAMSNEDMLNKLNELSTIIQKQQQEIEMLKQELKKQKESINQVKETQKEEITKIVKTETEEKSKEWSEKVPKWIKDTKVSGDLRLRYEGIYNREERQTDGSIKDLPNRDRFRIRARLFFDSNISDEVSTHFMLCTNQDTYREATTTNQSFTDDFNDKGIYLHRAYAAYKPNWLSGLELTGGKFKNTFMHTDIMWDPDVNPEGFYERYQHQGWKNFKPFVHLGQMVVNEVKNETDDAALFIYQAGFDWNIGKVKWTLAGSYYDWANLENSKYLHEANYKSGGGNSFILDANGNLQYAYGYNLWEGISHVKFKLGEIPTTLIFDYIVNTADNVPNDQDTAYYIGFNLGKAKKKGDWSIGYKYARIERDAVIGSMNDQDFYGANRKGHKVKFKYMLLDRLRFDVAYFNTGPVTDWDTSDVTFSKNKEREHEDRVQTDLIFSF